MQDKNNTDKLQQTVEQLRERGKKIIKGTASLYDINKELKYSEIKAFGELLHSDKPLEVTDIDIKHLIILNYETWLEMVSTIYKGDALSDPEYPYVLQGLSEDRVKELSSIIKKKAIESCIENTITFFDPSRKVDLALSVAIPEQSGGDLNDGWKIFNDLNQNNITESKLTSSSGLLNKQILQEVMMQGRVNRTFADMACGFCSALGKGQKLNNDVGIPETDSFLERLSWSAKREVGSLHNIKEVSDDLVGRISNNISKQDIIEKFPLNQLLVMSRGITILNLQDMQPKTKLVEVINDIMEGIIKLFEKILGQNKPVTHPYIGAANMREITKAVNKVCGNDKVISR